MPKVLGRDAVISDLSQRILDGLERVEQAARSELGKHRDLKDPNTVVAYGSNAMANGYRGHEFVSVGSAQQAAADGIRRLIKEPFSVRVVVEDEDGGRRILYVARSATLKQENLRSLDGSLATYRSPLGRVAECGPGEEVVVKIRGSEETLLVRERVRLEPARDPGGWDGLHDYIETDEFNATVPSLRAFLDAQAARKPAVEDFVGAIEADERAAATVFDGIRRKTVERMSLRDLAVLDRYQGDVFRLPLNRRLMLSGPPGTGKTTTLVKRVALKSRIDDLGDEDRELVPEDRASEVFRQGNWVMFAPTALLRLYLREAFNQEDVAAPEQRIRTWADERIRLARNVFRILKSATGGRFHLDEDVSTLAEASAEPLTRLADDFAAAFRKQIVERYRRHLDGLGTPADPTLRQLLNQARRLAGGAAIEFDRLFDLITLHEEIAVHEQRLEKEAGEALNVALNRLLARERTLLERLIVSMRDLTEGVDEDDDDEDDTEPEAPSVGPRDPRGAALRLLREAVSARARELEDGRPRTRTGVRGRVLALIGKEAIDEMALRPIGSTLVALEHLRFLGRTHRNLVERVPTEFQRFRRASLAAKKWYRSDAKKAFTLGKVIGHEIDAMLLVSLRNATRFLNRDGGRALRGQLDSRYAVLQSVRGELVTQVLVDEVTDFSPVQLACMLELARPEFRSFFVCGDVRQRVTPWGVTDLDSLRWVSRDFDIREVSIGYRQSRPLALLAEALAGIGGAPETRLTPPPNVEDPGIQPILGEGLAGTALAEWLSDRIRQIEQALGSVPSIAVFVDGETAVEDLVHELSPLLREHNIEVMACRDGRMVGSDAQVRVFNVEHIKGLEFEAVFFAGVDRLAERIPSLFDKYLFVGVTRAATYLGMTCEARLPKALEPLRPQLGATWG